jgi:hypothetical protein
MNSLGLYVQNLERETGLKPATFALAMRQNVNP